LILTVQFQIINHKKGLKSFLFLVQFSLKEAIQVIGYVNRIDTINRPRQESVRTCEGFWKNFPKWSNIYASLQYTAFQTPVSKQTSSASFNM